MKSEGIERVQRATQLLAELGGIDILDALVELKALREKYQHAADVAERGAEEVNRLRAQIKTDDGVETYVPDPKEFQFERDQQLSYLAAQGVLEVAITRHGLERGVSVALSGITRELRRHLKVEQVTALLHQLADTTADVAKYDAPDAPKK